MLVDQRLSPTPQELAAFLLQHLRAHRHVLQVVTEAEVAYQGRAASVAEAGQYLMLLKPDGSVQVQGGRGVKPVNWQPATDEIRADVREGLCVITASRNKPPEVITVTCTAPALVQALDLQQEGRFVLQGSEAQLQATLARHPHLIEPGLTVLDRELLTAVGDIDLYARDQQGRYVVVELKRARATQDAAHQLHRYVQATAAFLGHPVRGILAAPAITAPARTQLQGAGLEFVEVQALPAARDEAAQGALF